MIILLQKTSPCADSVELRTISWKNSRKLGNDRSYDPTKTKFSVLDSVNAH
jgi:hypothetical protein